VVSDLTGVGPDRRGQHLRPTRRRAALLADLAATHTYHWDGAEFDAGTRVATPLPSTAPGDG